MRCSLKFDPAMIVLSMSVELADPFAEAPEHYFQIQWCFPLKPVLLHHLYVDMWWLHLIMPKLRHEKPP
eukprot:scaffold37386_cov69-Cyclotella_meneghiniana.AAC.7